MSETNSPPEPAQVRDASTSHDDAHQREIAKLKADNKRLADRLALSLAKARTGEAPIAEEDDDETRQLVTSVERLEAAVGVIRKHQESRLPNLLEAAGVVPDLASLAARALLGDGRLKVAEDGSATLQLDSDDATLTRVSAPLSKENLAKLLPAQTLVADGVPGTGSKPVKMPSPAPQLDFSRMTHSEKLRNLDKMKSMIERGQ